MVRTSQSIATLRAFNRLYTNKLGFLEARFDQSPFTLSEARVLYELAQRTEPTAAELARELRMDRAQISRTLKRFAARELIVQRDDPTHGRQQLITLSDGGWSAFEDLDARTEQAIGTLLESLPEPRRSRVVRAAADLGGLIADTEPPQVVLRGLEAGDLGAVTARQALLYAREYGWDRQYETLVSRILAAYGEDHDPTRDDAWIAEVDGEMVGSIFLVHGDDPEIGKLRLLYVEPHARGLGIGEALVTRCIDRARELGYGTLSLWTNSVLSSARRLYERSGFRLVEEKAHRSFGHDLVGQTWTLALRRR